MQPSLAEADCRLVPYIRRRWLTIEHWQDPTAKPTAYWSGRFMSLNDKLLNDVFDSDEPLEDAENFYRKRTDTAELSRARQIFKKLEAECNTRQDLRSLKVWLFRHGLDNI